MGMNIKSPRVHELAQRAAEATGTTMTGAVERALEDLLAAEGQDLKELEVQRKWALAKPIIEAYAAEDDVDGPIRTPEDLYDDRGLPA